MGHNVLFFVFNNTFGSRLTQMDTPKAFVKVLIFHHLRSTRNCIDDDDGDSQYLCHVHIWRHIYVLKKCKGAGSSSLFLHKSRINKVKYLFQCGNSILNTGLPAYSVF